MHGEAGNVILEVNGAQLAILHDDAVIVKGKAAALHMPAGTLDGIAGHGDMAMSATERDLHDFKALSHEIGVFVLVDGPSQQLGQRLCILHGLLRRTAVHAHMADFQAQHLVDGAAG